MTIGWENAAPTTGNRKGGGEGEDSAARRRGKKKCSSSYDYNYARAITISMKGGAFSNRRDKQIREGKDRRKSTHHAGRSCGIAANSKMAGKNNFMGKTKAERRMKK